MSVNQSTMTSREFELTIDELVKGMTALHNRLLRIEKWMLRQEELRKKLKPYLTINERRK